MTRARAGNPKSWRRRLVSRTDASPRTAPSEIAANPGHWTEVGGLLASLYPIVDRLELLFPGRKFTPDGHLVGSIGEVIAARMFGLELLPASAPDHDAITGDGRRVGSSSPRACAAWLYGQNRTISSSVAWTGTAPSKSSTTERAGCHGLDQAKCRTTASARFRSRGSAPSTAPFPNRTVCHSDRRFSSAFLMIGSPPRVSGYSLY